MAITTGVTHFTNDGEVKMLEAIFKGATITPLKLGLFSQNSNTGDAEATTMTNLTVLTSTGNSGYVDITLQNSAWTIAGGGATTGSAQANTGSAYEFTNSGATTWTSAPLGFYVSTGSGASEKLLFFQQEATAISMTAGSKYQITLNIQLE